MFNNSTNRRKNVVVILTIVIVSILFSSISSQLTLIAFGASADVGFQDGLSDCQSGTSDAINGHSNAGHHSAAYMDAYNRGLVSCNNGGGSSNGASSPADTTAAPITNNGNTNNNGPDWMQICNTVHDFLNLKSPCSTYVQNGQLTQAGVNAILCIGGGGLLNVLAILQPHLAIATSGIQAAGQKFCP